MKRFVMMMACACALLALTPTAMANDAEYGSYSGVPTPIKNDSISMVAEEIVFNQLVDTWRVNATYTFENKTKKTVKLKMGYPETEADHSGSQFNGLKTWVRGKEVKLETKKSAQMKKPWKGYRLGRVHLFDVEFAPGETVEIKHTFDMAGGSSVALACEREVAYITRTGRLWNGPIGSARFIVNLRAVYDAYVIPEGYDLKSYTRSVIKKGERTGSKFVFEMKDWTPEKDFKFIMMQECGSEAGMDVYYTGKRCPYWEVEEIVSERLEKPDKKLAKEDVQKRTAKLMSALEPFDDAQLRTCRNHIYARYGYSFKSKDLRKRYYSHAPGKKHIYPPHFCIKKDGEEMIEYCRQERLILYTEDKGFTPNMLTRMENEYVRVLKEEEKRRKQQKKAGAASAGGE